MKRKGYPIVELLISVIMILFFIVAPIGYGLGIYRLASCDFEAPYKAEAIYAIGLFSGANVVLGWFDFGK